jgi:hypothetical protein
VILDFRCCRSWRQFINLWRVHLCRSRDIILNSWVTADPRSATASACGVSRRCRRKLGLSHWLRRPRARQHDAHGGVFGLVACAPRASALMLTLAMSQVLGNGLLGALTTATTACAATAVRLDARPSIIFVSCRPQYPSG